jgi:hypothetical protein
LFSKGYVHILTPRAWECNLDKGSLLMQVDHPKMKSSWALSLMTSAPIRKHQGELGHRGDESEMRKPSLTETETEVIWPNRMPNATRN